MSLADISYETLFAAVYTVIDDWYQQEGWRLVRSRPGVKPRFGDSEVLTLEVMRELEGRRGSAGGTPGWPPTGVLCSPACPSGACCTSGPRA